MVGRERVQADEQIVERVVLRAQLLELRGREDIGRERRAEPPGEGLVGLSEIVLDLWNTYTPCTRVRSAPRVGARLGGALCEWAWAAPCGALRACAGIP